VRGLQPLPAWQAEEALRGLQLLPAWQAEKPLRGLHGLPTWQAETQLRGLQRLPAQQVEKQVRRVSTNIPVDRTRAARAVHLITVAASRMSHRESLDYVLPSVV
jgi:hypothetical protein